MEHAKKCTHCGQWSRWTLSLDDRCEHCGEWLQEQEKKHAEEKELLRQLQEKAFLFHIRETDNLMQRLLKRGGYVVYLILLSIASFLSWLLFWLGP